MFVVLIIKVFRLLNYERYVFEADFDILYRYLWERPSTRILVKTKLMYYRHKAGRVGFYPASAISYVTVLVVTELSLLRQLWAL